MKNQHRDWLDRTTGGASLRQIGAHTTLNYSSLSRQLRDGRGLTADQVIEVSRAYGAEPIQALRDTGYLGPNEGDVELTAQAIAERIARDTQKLAELAAAAEAADEHEDNVISFPSQDSVYDDETPEPPQSDMPEGAAAFGGKIYGDPDDDHDY